MKYRQVVICYNADSKKHEIIFRGDDIERKEPIPGKEHKPVPGLRSYYYPVTISDESAFEDLREAMLRELRKVQTKAMDAAILLYDTRFETDRI